MRLGVEHRMPDRAELVALIGDRVHLVRERVVMRVRGVRTGERAVEGIVRDRLQPFGHFGGGSARLDDRESAACDADDRSEARRVGNGWLRTCRYRWWRYQ